MVDEVLLRNILGNIREWKSGHKPPLATPKQYAQVFKITEQATQEALEYLDGKGMILAETERTNGIISAIHVKDITATGIDFLERKDRPMSTTYQTNLTVGDMTNSQIANSGA